jgi:predicted secreted Zn-dependent protease
MDEAAKAEWFPRYEYVADKVVTSAAIVVATRITMPRWTRQALTAERAEWNRFCVALKTHEEGHIDLVVKHLHDVDKHMLGKSPAGAIRVWERVIERLNSASRAYDGQTDHGRKQGTVIVVSGR